MSSVEYRNYRVVEDSFERDCEPRHFCLGLQSHLQSTQFPEEKHPKFFVLRSLDLISVPKSLFREERKVCDFE